MRKQSKQIALYIFWFLHQTTTHDIITCKRNVLYIFWFLHQTTTCLKYNVIGKRCISFDSYIKPQLRSMLRWLICVVYLLIPTSNHNYLADMTNAAIVVYLLIPTSNHNTGYVASWFAVLYIFWFLHQTTTYRFRSTDFQHITITFSNKKWWVGYYFLCKSTKKTPIESVHW